MEILNIRNIRVKVPNIRKIITELTINGWISLVLLALLPLWLFAINYKKEEGEYIYHISLVVLYCVNLIWIIFSLSNKILIMRNKVSKKLAWISLLSLVFFIILIEIGMEPIVRSSYYPGWDIFAWIFFTIWITVDCLQLFKVYK